MAENWRPRTRSAITVRCVCGHYPDQHPNAGFARRCTPEDRRCGCQWYRAEASVYDRMSPAQQLAALDRLEGRRR